MILEDLKGSQRKERQREYDSVLGENLISKWPLVRGWKRQERCKLLKHLPEEHGDTRKDT